MIYYEPEVNPFFDGDATMVKILFKIFVAVQTSVISPICAMALFRIFESLNIGANRVINRIAETTFGVYLIHDSLIGRSYIWNDLIKIDTVWYLKPLFPIYAIFFIGAVFIGCALIDMLRIKLFEPVMMNSAGKISDKLKKDFFLSEVEYSRLSRATIPEKENHFIN